ncbi:MAG: response regulator [Pyrinomonadaceae bacterium]
MQSFQNQTKILLIGDNFGKLEGATSALLQAGYDVLPTIGGREGFRLARREKPDLIISEIDLPDISGLELCRMIRADRELCSIPFVFISETHQNGDVVNDVCRAGADDFLTEFSNPQQLAAKAAWFIERKNSEESLRNYYQILRDRQIQITGIIKNVSNLFTDLDFELKTASSEETGSKQLDKRIDLGMSMVSALANLLNEQIKALNIGERSLRGEIFVINPQPQDYRPDSQPITYDLVID